MPTKYEVSENKLQYHREVIQNDITSKKDIYLFEIPKLKDIFQVRRLNCLFGKKNLLVWKNIFVLEKNGNSTKVINLFTSNIIYNRFPKLMHFIPGQPVYTRDTTVKLSVSKCKWLPSTDPFSFNPFLTKTHIDHALKCSTGFCSIITFLNFLETYWRQ